jgi:hypothetical protein
MAKELWEIAKGPGQPPCFSSPQEMWDRAVEYFKWCGEHVILEDKIFKTKSGLDDKLEHEYIAHKRPMTLAGLHIFLNISEQTWYNYKKKDEYLGITNSIDRTMYENKFSGASVGQFNANIIARDLGLADKTDLTTNGKDINKDMDSIELSDRLEKLGISIER